jgi:hypothetical protein
MVSIEVRHKKHVETARYPPRYDRSHRLNHTRDRDRTAVINIHEVGQRYRVFNKGRPPDSLINSKVPESADVEAALTDR